MAQYDIYIADFMKKILEKLTKEEIKELSKAINTAQKGTFGESLSLRKQEDFMARVFNEKNWSTVLGLASKEKEDIYDAKAEYQRTTVTVEILSNGFYDDPNDLTTLHHDIVYGDCSGVIKEVNRESLSQMEMKTALEEQGSDPRFLISLCSKKEDFLDSVVDKINDLLEEEFFENYHLDVQKQMLGNYIEKYEKNTKLNFTELDFDLYLED